MNVVEINPGTLGTINRYVEVTVALTVLTFYIVVTLQTHTSFHEKGATLQRRAAWPILLLWRAVKIVLARPILLLWRAVERNQKFLGPQEKPKSL